MEATKAVWVDSKMCPAGCPLVSVVMKMPIRTDTVALGPRHTVMAECGGRKEQMVDVETREAAREAKDVTMAETVTMTTTPIATETEIGALAPND
jgi:hypothetical protein